MINSSIYLWNTISKNIHQKFLPLSKSSKELYLLQQPVANLHSHFKPLINTDVYPTYLQDSTSLTQIDVPFPTKKHNKKMKNLAREYHSEKNNCIDLEPLTEAQNMVYTTKQQHTILDEQQREYQQLDLNKAFFTIYTNSNSLQKTFQSCNVDSHAKIYTH